MRSVRLELKEARDGFTEVETPPGESESFRKMEECGGRRE